MLKRVVAGSVVCGVEAVCGDGFVDTSVNVVSQMVRGIHGQREGDGAVAVERGLQIPSLSECAGLVGVELEAVEVVRSALTNRIGQLRDGGLVYEQVQRGGAVTTVYIKVGMLVVVRLGGVDDVESVLVVVTAGADVRHNFAALLRTDVQVQDDDTVTTACGSHRVGINAGYRKGLVAKSIVAVETDGVIAVGLVGGRHDEGQRGGAVAAEDCLVVVGERIGARRFEGGVEAVAGVVFASTNFIAQHDELGGRDGEGQLDGAVAAIDILKR